MQVAGISGQNKCLPHGGVCHFGVVEFSLLLGISVLHYIVGIYGFLSLEKSSDFLLRFETVCQLRSGLFSGGLHTRNHGGSFSTSTVSWRRFERL